jgi:DNA ligase-1
MIDTIKRPMLAATAENVHHLKNHWPGVVLASPKLDGIRCLTHPSLGAVSRNFKPIPNEHIRSILSPVDCEVPYLDGELVTFTNDKIDDFNTIQSKVMSRDGEPDWKFMVFDSFAEPEAPFIERLMCARGQIGTRLRYGLVEHTQLRDPEDFLGYAQACLEQGYEGAMYRFQMSPYKAGRSTLRQGWLVKWKEFADAEGVVIGFQEKLHNGNEQTQDAFGLAERSSHKANMEATGMLGALVLKTSWGIINVGTGFTDIERQRIWNHQKDYMGHTVTFKYQPFGVKDVPRFPVFKSWRVAE